MLKTPRRLLAAVALVTAVGCGDDGGSGPTGTITVSASPTALTVQQGGSGTVTVTLVRGGGFDQAVNVSVSGLPSGVTASVNPTQLTGNTTTATVTVNVGPTVAAGVYTATVTASATGVGSATTQYTLTVTAAPQQNFTLSANPATVNITAGGTGTSTIQIARTDFTGAIALSLVNAPTGITGTFEPASPTANQSTLTLSVAGTVAPGNHTVTVQGVGGGLQRTTTVTVTVAAGPSVTLAMNPTTLSIQQGQSGNSTLTATRSNFNGNITPSVTGNPAGMTVTFNPTPLTANTSDVTVNVGAGVAPGNYTLTISGNTGGTAGTPTTTLAVTVTQAPAGGNIVWDFCTADGAPLKFWRLSGGTWSEVTPTTVGGVTRYSFTVADGQAGVAFTTSSGSISPRQALSAPTKGGFRSVSRDVREKSLDAQMRMRGLNVAQQQGDFFDTFVWFAMSNELAGFAEAGCSTDPTSATKVFNVTNQGAGEQGVLGYGGTSTSLTSGTTAYTVNAPAGSHDYMALWGPTPTFPDLTQNWNAYRIGRDVATGGTAVDINRTGAPAFVPFAVTVTGGAGGSFYNFIQTLEGSRGPVVSFPLGSFLNTSGTVNMLFPQPGDRLPTDLWSLMISNTELVGENINTRIQTRYVGSAPPASGTFALVAAVPAFTTSQVNGAPVPSWVASGSIPADYQQPTSIVSAAFAGGNLGQLFTIAATRAWLQANNMGTNYTLTSPTLPGFLQAWAPAAPLDNATVIMLGTNLTTAPTAGSVINIGSRTQ